MPIVPSIKNGQAGRILNRSMKCAAQGLQSFMADAPVEPEWAYQMLLQPLIGCLIIGEKAILDYAKELEREALVMMPFTDEPKANEMVDGYQFAMKDAEATLSKSKQLKLDLRLAD